MADPWYPEASEYFFSSAEAEQVPLRQGDIFGPSKYDVLTGWHGFMIVHPSCEIQTAKAKQVQVARLRPVTDLVEPFQQTAVTYGFTDRDGIVKVAFAHTFWLPPAAVAGPFGEPMFADFREVACIPLDILTGEPRVAAMTHEARLYLIRRKIHFRYRWNVGLSTIRELEAERIRGDANFQGPKPAWVSL